MKAWTVTPGTADSARVEDRPEPEPGEGQLLVEGIAVGICGTDREIAGGRYGWSPHGADRLVLGHESLGRVLRGAGDFSPGDLVAGIVRRPDPEPCGACAAGEFDMCRNGRYRERGIKELDGYGAEQWVVEADYAVRVDPALGLAGVLTEPTSVVAKAWEQVERIGDRAWFEPRTALVTGAGPVGLLAAMLGVQRGLDVHVLDRVSDGPKPELVRTLGATYRTEDVAEVTGSLQPDVVIEATGAGPVVLDVLTGTGPYGIVCLTGVSSGGHTLRVDAGAMNREVVLENDAVVGSVNANRRHYQQATDALAAADPDWLHRLITREVPLAEVADALEPRDDDVKTVVRLTSGSAG